MTEVGWAIISTGRHPEARMAPAINKARNSRLVAVMSRDLERARAFAARHGAPRAYDSLEAVLSDPDVQAVYIASPNYLHAEQTLAAVRAGKHVLVEKPMALTVEDGRRMVAAARQAGVKLGVAFHCRHHPAHREARQVVRSGALGEIVYATASWSALAPGPRPEWWSRPEQVGGGAIMGTGVHVFDLLRFVLGREVVEVFAYQDSPPIETTDSVLFKFEDGSTAHVVCSRKVAYPNNDLNIYGLAGRIRSVDTISTDLKGSLEVTTAAGSTVRSFEADDPPRAMYVGLVEDFARAVLEGCEPAATGEDGLKVIELTLAVFESNRTGRAVPVGRA
jgi:1,5-anhydro-D-fructose reductase (1,5-anhydro-D-mannitol-forming)